jgi:hypothetical protein
MSVPNGSCREEEVGPNKGFDLGEVFFLFFSFSSFWFYLVFSSINSNIV